MDPTAAIRRRRAGAAKTGLAIAGAALLVLAALLATRSPGALRLSSACGGRASVEVGGVAQVCTFDDEFDGSTLNTHKWQVISTLRIGFHTTDECFVDDGAHVTVGAGVADLTMTRSAPGGACSRHGLALESGILSTQQRWAQTYGRFSIRAQLPHVVGLQPALWLYPEHLSYGPWPASGEIDIAEVFGAAAETWPHLHYLAADGLPAHPGKGCVLGPSRSGFHTYTVDWTRTELTFRYDQQVCLTVRRWIPRPPLSTPAPFDKPFAVLLALSTGFGSNAPSAALRLPQHMRIDYVRVWGRS